MKVLLSDLDGTLCFRTEIKNEDIQAIKKFKKAGNFFGVNTGRGHGKAITGTMDGNEWVPFDLIFADSSSVVKNSKGEIIEAHPLSWESIEKLHEAFPENVQVYTVDGKYFTLRSNKSKQPAGWEIGHVDSIHDLSGEKIYSISVKTESEEEARTVAKEILDLKIPVEASVNTRYIDVTAKGFNKAQAISAASRILGSKKEDIYAIGDSWNDLPALEAAGKGFLMDSASDDLKQEAAKHGIETVSSVAEAIEKILNEDE